MEHYTKRDILRMVEEEDVEFIRLQFVDLFGNLKNTAVTAGQLARVLDQGYVFDGSCVEGFLHDNDTDMFLCPDLDTLAVFPWRPQQGKVARLICDIHRPDGTVYSGDPRGILKRAVRHAEELGYQFDVGPECEFFLFHADEDGTPTTLTHECATYFDMGPVDLGENARRDMVLTLEDMGFVIESSHHEKAAAQHEIDFHYDEALTAADNMVTAKMVVKTIAKRHGLHATFMPKPKYGVNGSGMHLNLSLSRNGVNVFSDPEDEKGLSREAYWFIGGIMEHIKAITFITNPIVNSYKRLVPGYEAPVYIAWSAKNRTPLIRIPASSPQSTRIELRSPDPSANPYLALAVCLAAGLNGIRNQTMPPGSIDCNIFEMGEEGRRKAGIERLPGSLLEAAREFYKDPFIMSVLGEELSRKYIRAKTKEYAEYREQVTEWELEKYLHVI